MFESLIRESPLLSGVIAAVATVFVFLVVSAMVTGWRSKRTTTPSVQREPVFDRGRLGRQEPERPYPLPRSEPEVHPRRGFGFAALAVAFLIGLAAGVAGFAYSSTGAFGPVLQNVAGLIGDGLSGAGDAAGLDQPIAHPAAPDPQPAGPAAPLSDDVKARLAIFAGKLKETLPREAGPELLLTRVETDGSTLNLGYTLGRAMPEDEIPKFNGYIMRAARSLFCDKGAREIRFLNENGVFFNMAYVDSGGQTLAKFTVSRDFCD